MVSNIRFRSFRSLVSPKSGKPYGLIAAGRRARDRLRAHARCHRHRAGLRLPARAAAAARRVAAGPARCPTGSRRPCRDRASRPAGRRPGGRRPRARARRVREGAARGAAHRGAAHRRAVRRLPRPVRARRRARRRGRRHRPVVPQLLHLARHARHLPRGPLRLSPRHRGTGLGRELLRTLAAVCVERGYSRLEWSVLDWNTPSIEFYKAAGAVPMDEWTRLPPHRRRPDRLRRRPRQRIADDHRGERADAARVLAHRHGRRAGPRGEGAARRRRVPRAAGREAAPVPGAHQQLDLHAARPRRPAGPRGLQRARGVDLDLGAGDGGLPAHPAARRLGLRHRRGRADHRAATRSATPSPTPTRTTSSSGRPARTRSRRSRGRSG